MRKPIEQRWPRRDWRASAPFVFAACSLCPLQAIKRSSLISRRVLQHTTDPHTDWHCRSNSFSEIVNSMRALYAHRPSEEISRAVQIYVSSIPTATQAESSLTMTEYTPFNSDILYRRCTPSLRDPQPWDDYNQLDTPNDVAQQQSYLHPPTPSYPYPYVKILSATMKRPSISKTRSKACTYRCPWLRCIPGFILICNKIY